MCLIVYSNDHAPLTVRLIYSSSKLRTVQMMIFSLVAMIGLAKCCITSACLQWLCHSGERIVARGPLVATDHSKAVLLVFVFSSPEQMLSVSYCDHPLSVFCCCPSANVIIMNLGKNVCYDHF